MLQPRFSYFVKNRCYATKTILTK